LLAASSKASPLSAIPCAALWTFTSSECLVDDASGFGFNRFEQLGQIGQLAGAVGDADAVDYPSRVSPSRMPLRTRPNKA
jgi:hypothetical protein